LDIETNTSTTYLDINNTAGDGDPAINFQLSGTTTFSLGLDDGDSDKFKIGTTAIGTNTRLTIDGSGNVGIGTTGPQNLLDVRGEARFGPNLSEGIKLGEHEIKLLNNGTGHFSIVNTDAAGLQIQTTSSSVALGTAATNVIMTFETAGDVGIGTTNPTATLEVDGDAIFNNSGADVDFRVEGDTDTELLFIDASADMVGISTTVPSHTLDVAGEARFGPNANEGVKLGNHEIKLLNAGVGHFSIVNTDAAGLQIQTTSSSSALGTAASNVIMTFESGGDVGIGTTSPTATLDVDGDMILQNGTDINEFSIDGTMAGNSDDAVPTEQAVKEYVDAKRYIYNAHGVDIDNMAASNGHANAWNKYGAIVTSSNNGVNMVVSGRANERKAFIQCGHSSSGYASYVGTLALNPYGGNVGVGVLNPGYKLTVNGQPGANGYTAFTNYSDKRLKTNISTLDTGVLSKILQLNPVEFQYNEKYLQLYPESNLEKVHKGFIAQEIQKVFPEMVSEMKESSDSVNYLDLDISHLQVYLVQALQEQQAIIEAQKKEIATEKAENESQKQEIETIKAEASSSSVETNQKLKETAQKLAALEAKLNALLLLNSKGAVLTAEN